MSKDEIQDLSVKLSMDSTGFQEGISQVNRQMAVAKQEFRLASTQLGGLGNSTEQMKLKADSLAKQMELQKQKVDALSRAYEESRQKSGENTKATDDLRIKLLSAQRQEAELENQLKQVNNELKNQNSAFNNASAGASGFSRILQNAFSITLGIGFFDMIRSGFNYAKEAAFGFNSSLQQTTIAFTTLIGSAEKANEYIQWMMDYSSKTPFEFKDLAEGSRLLMAFGFEASQIPPMLEAIGNTASGLGMKGSEGLNRIGLQLGQMNTLGKATYQDLKQLAQAGVPVWDILAEAIGKSTGEVQELVSKGLLPAGETIDVLIAGMNEKFGGMMENQSKSWQGLSSSIKDNISIALGTLTQGLFQEASGMLEHISISLENFNAIAKDEGMRAALETLIPKPLVDGIALMKNGLEWVTEHGTVVKASLIGIAAGFTAIKLAGLIKDLSESTKKFTDFSKVLNVANVKTLIIGAGIAVLAGGAYILYRNWEHVGPFFHEMWNMIDASFETGFGAVNVILASLQVALAEVLRFTLGNVTSWVSGLLGLFANIPKIGEEFKKAQAGVDSFNKGLDNFAKDSRYNLDRAVSQTKSSTNEVVASYNRMKDAGSNMVNAIGDDLSGLITKTKETFKSMGDTSEFDTSSLSMEEAGGNLVDAIGKGAEKKKKATKEKLDKIASEINTAIILIDAEIKRLLADDSSLEVQQANIQRAMELTIDKIKILEGEFTRLSKSKNVNKDALNQLTKEIENTKFAYDELGKKLVDITEKIYKANIKTANDFVEQIKGALKRRYDEEKELRESNLNDEIKALDNWKDESIKRINDVYSAKIKRIEDSSNAQIEALNSELRALEDYQKDKSRAEQDKEDLDKINRLKDAIDYEHNEYNKVQLQKELANAEKDYAKRKDQEKLEDKKQAIRDEIANVREKARLEKEILQQRQNEELARINDLYTANKESLQQQLKDVREFYKIRLQDAQLQAEAEQMIMKNNQEAIMNLLYQYTDHYKAVGQTFGDKMVEGFAPMIDEIHKMIDEVMARISKARSSALSVPQVDTSLTGSKGGSSKGDIPVSEWNKDGSFKQYIFNTEINSPTVKTPSQERRDWETANRNMIFQAELA